MQKNSYVIRTIRELIPQDRIWDAAPFMWVYEALPNEREEIGKQLIAGWCAARGLNVTRSPDSDADKIIEGKRVEIKFSTLWENGGYTFQQIRDQNYEYLICLGISPFDAHAWIFKKKNIPFSRLKHQHGGSRGRDTWWLTFPPNRPPTWMRKYSGKLRDVYQVLRKF